MAQSTLPPSVRREPLRAIFLAVLLGLAAGFAQGWNLSLVGLLLLVVFFNVRARLFLLIWLLGVGLSWLLVPLSYATGRFVLDSTPVGSLLGLFGSTPAVALLAWDRYTVVGGLLVAAALSVPAFITVRGWIQSLRARRVRPAANYDRPPQTPADEQARAAQPNRLACWLLIDDSAESGEGLKPLVRPLGLWGLVVGAGLSMVAAWWIAPQRSAALLLSTITRANRAQVDVGQIEFDLWGGRAELHDVALADPNELTEDRLRIETLTVEFDPVALLQGRIEIGCLRLAGIACHQLRQHLAQPVRPRIEFASSPTEAPRTGFPAHEAEGGELPLAEYLGDWDSVVARCRQLGEICDLLESLPGYECQSNQSPLRQPLQLGHFRQARSPLGRPRPTIFAKSVVVEKLPESWQLGTGAVVRMADVNSNVRLCPRPMRLEIEAPDRGLRLQAALDLRQQPYRRQVELQLRNVALADHLAPTSSKQRLACESGTVSLQAKGWFAGEQLELDCLIDGADLMVRLFGGRPVAGLAPDIWNESINCLGNVRLTAKLQGQLASPRLSVDEIELARYFERRLRTAGEVRLATIFADRVARETQLATATTLLPPAKRSNGPAEQPSPPAAAAIDHAAVAALSQSSGPTAPEAVATRIPIVVTERLCRLPPIPLEVPSAAAPAATSTAPATAASEPAPAPPISLASSSALTSSGDAPCGLPPAGPPEQHADAIPKTPSRLAEQLSALSADPFTNHGNVVDNQFDEINETGLPASDPPFTEEGRQSGLTSWTRAFFARARDAWPLKRQKSVSNPFVDATENDSLPREREGSLLSRRPRSNEALVR
jgi:uncharacterized protein (TIGR03546 family)